MSFVDTVMAGRLGSVTLAAVAVKFGVPPSADSLLPPPPQATTTKATNKVTANDLSWFILPAPD